MHVARFQWQWDCRGGLCGRSQGLLQYGHGQFQLLAANSSGATYKTQPSSSAVGLAPLPKSI